MIQHGKAISLTLALAAAVGVTSGLAIRAVRLESAPAAVIVQTEAKSPRSPNISLKPVSLRQSAVLLCAVIRAECLDAGEQIQIALPNRTPVQTITVDSNHEALVEDIAPGQYLAYAERIGEMLFSLKENAAVEVLGGCGWDDGEILYLDQHSGIIQIECLVPATAVDPKEGLTCTYSLINEDYVSDKILHFTVETEQQNGYYRMISSYKGLSDGQYTLLENGIAVENIRIQSKQRAIKLIRYPQAAAGDATVP